MTRSTDGQTTDRIVASPQRRARERILRSAVLLAVVGVFYTVVVVWQRDTTRRNDALGMVEPFRRVVQAALDDSGQLPLALKNADGIALPTDDFTYLPPEDIRTLRAFDDPILLGYSRPSAAGFQRGGRGVLICEHRQCRVEWVVDRKFAERLAEQAKQIEEHRRRSLDRGPKLP